MKEELPEPSTLALMAAVEIDGTLKNKTNTYIIAQIIQKYMNKEKEKVNAN